MENDFGLISVPYAEAAQVVVQVPYEGTVSYGKGAACGPSAIVTASQSVELYDFVTDRDYESLRFATLPPLVPGDATPAEVMEKVFKEVSAVVEEGKYPLVLGGEHSITAPAVRAVGQRYEIGVVQVDAHADLRNEYNGSPHNHACVMARVREEFPAIQLGIRSCSREEKELMEAQNFVVLTPSETFEENALERALETLPDRVYLTIDLDGYDPSVMASTGTPEPGGFDWEQMCQLIETVADRKQIVGADVVELAPIRGLHAPDFLAAKTAFNILWYLGRER